MMFCDCFSNYKITKHRKTTVIDWEVLKMLIRKKELKDVEPWISVNISSWSDHLKGVVSNRVLSIIASNKEERIKREKENFVENNNCYVLEEHGEVVGILKVKQSDREGFLDCGEVQVLYLLKKVKQKGYGKALLSKAFEVLKEQGFQKVVIGCLDQNPANEFYKHMGGVSVRQEPWTIFEETYMENVYLFDL